MCKKWDPHFNKNVFCIANAMKKRNLIVELLKGNIPIRLIKLLKILWILKSKTIKEE